MLYFGSISGAHLPLRRDGPFGRTDRGIVQRAQFAAVLRWSAVGMVFSAASFVHGTRFTKKIDFGRPTLRDRPCFLCQSEIRPDPQKIAATLMGRMPHLPYHFLQ